MSVELDLGTQPDGMPYRIPIEALNYHLQAIGPTGYGKTYFLHRLWQQLALKTDSAQIYIDPTGNAYRFLKRWSYEQGLDDRLVLIDPKERRLICGFNPIAPWDENHELQALIAVDLMRRAMGTEDFMQAPRMARWMFNVVYGLIEAGLTMHEAPFFLDYEEHDLREAIISRLPHSHVRSDFQWLTQEMRRSTDSARRLADEHLGSSINRFRHYTNNPNLRLMLATQNAIDWKEILDQRKIVLVNLQSPGVLGDEHQRMFGLQIVNELIQEAFRREEEGCDEEVVPTYLFIDEFQDFAAPGLAKILTGGRQYLLRLILAHHDLSQLVDVRNNDRKLYSAVMGCARAKVVFGGLISEDADAMGRLLYWHHLDPDKRQLEIHDWQQLSYLADAESYTVGDTEGWNSSRARGRGTSRGAMRSRTRHRDWGRSRSVGSSLGFGSNSGTVQGDSATYGPNGDVTLGTNSQFSRGVQDMLSYQEIDATNEMEGVGESEGENEKIDENTLEGEGETGGLQRSVTYSEAVRPGEPFLKLSSVQFEPLETQLHRHVSKMIGRSPYHAVFVRGKDFPEDFRCTWLEQPKIDIHQAQEIDLPLMRSLPFYDEPRVREEEIRARLEGLLGRAALPAPDAVPADWQPVPEPAAACAASNQPQARRSRSTSTSRRSRKASGGQS